MSAINHPPRRTLVLYADEALAPRARRHASEHLRRCPVCRREVEGFARVVGLLETAVPGEEVDLAADIDAWSPVPATGRPPRLASPGGLPASVARSRPTAWRRGAVAAMLLAILGSGLRHVMRQRDAGVQARAGVVTDAQRWTGVTPYRIREGQPPTALDITMEPSFARGDALAFSYINGSADPYPYLIIYGVDAAGAVHWFYPAYERAEDNPSSVSIAATHHAIRLPDAVHQDAAPGPYVLHAVFSREPLSIQHAEAAVASGKTAADISAGALEQVMALSVH